MQNSLFRRSMVCGITLLFIGVGVSPGISRDIEIMSNLSTEDTPTNFPFLDDELVAYWSFDEGSGNIAHDYSGHGYNGTIYGATWTTGHSGFALDFDGVDDNVSLDNHSENLGFNKTDDYRISVWINSTSTDPGMIYDISDSSGISPGAHVELNSNGALVIKVQVGVCGISVSSNGIYNDGLWHYVEVIFHGSTSEPTIEIYVDNQLVGSETDWLCPFYAYQFEKTKIGRRSHNATRYFDGVIDEVKVYKNPGGNQPPNPPDISGPALGIVYEEYNYTFVTTDPDGDNVSYWIDWDDGQVEEWIGPYPSYEEVTVNHSWDKVGTYDITAKARDVYDNEGNWSDPLTVEIVKPIIEISGITGRLFKVKALIKNIGGGDATNVSWNISLVGGHIYSGRYSSGQILSIPAGGETTVRSNVILGFGKLIAVVTAEMPDGGSDIRGRDAIVLLFFILWI